VKSLLSLCYSRAILESLQSLFSRLSLSVASSICAPFFVRSMSYSRAILKSLQSLFACHSEKCCVLFFWVCPMEHINCSSPHLTAIVRGGERYFFPYHLLSTFLNVLAKKRRKLQVNFIDSSLKVAKTRFHTFLRGKSVLFK